MVSQFHARAIVNGVTTSFTLHASRDVIRESARLLKLNVPGLAVFVAMLSNSFENLTVSVAQYLSQGQLILTESA
jgi:hypothetical protein